MGATVEGAALDGAIVVTILGEQLGLDIDGNTLADMEGWKDGLLVGGNEEANDGDNVRIEGTIDGVIIGRSDGIVVGMAVGNIDGDKVYGSGSGDLYIMLNADIFGLSAGPLTTLIFIHPVVTITSMLNACSDPNPYIAYKSILYSSTFCKV